MRLPNSNKAYIPKEKLTDYLLLESHPVGGSKAKFFRGLGFNESSVGELSESLLQMAKNDIKNMRKFTYGTNYMIEGVLETPIGKRIRIITVWFLKTKKSRPSFVTAYPV